MLKFNPLWWPKPPVILSYGVAVLSVIAAVIILWWMETALQAAAHVSLFLCAVMFSAWFGGVRPGLLAIALSALAFKYYFLPPLYSLAAEITHLPRLLLFALSALFTVSLSVAQRSVAESLRQARDQLQETFQELKRTNQSLLEQIAERKAVNERIQALSRHLVEVQESERKELSRELHDRVGQNLTALNINLEILKTRLSGDDRAELRSRLEDSISLVGSTADAIENVMSELRPPMLDSHGLLPALRWYVNEFSQRTGIDAAVSAKEPKQRLAQEIEITLFRIAQEALNNVAKHARATRIELELQHSGSECILSVSDNGIGFDPALSPEAMSRPSRGMVTMRERAQAVGGHFEVKAVPGGGTQIMVRVPC